jgi:hypothetical protein
MRDFTPMTYLPRDAIPGYRPIAPAGLRRGALAATASRHERPPR